MTNGLAIQKALSYLHPSDRLKTEKALGNVLSLRGEAIRVSDIKLTHVETTNKEKLRTYLSSIERTILTALITVLISTIIVSLSIGNLLLFLQGNKSYMHPYLAMFLIFGSIAIFFVAVFSVWSIKKQIKDIM